MFPSHHADRTDQDMSSLHREVLWTYRLLFGQSSSSRKLASKIIGRLNGDTDSFLHTICTASTTRSRLFRRLPNPELPAYLFPVTSRDMVDGWLNESDTYSCREDFPHFGPRLLAVQQYNLRQRPSRVRDLWRDRRNPLQWYTFWAVLWVGAITILLSFLQLVSTVVQTYYSASGGGV